MRWCEMIKGREQRKKNRLRCCASPHQKGFNMPWHLILQVSETLLDGWNSIISKNIVWFGAMKMVMERWWERKHQVGGQLLLGVQKSCDLVTTEVTGLDIALAFDAFVILGLVRFPSHLWLPLQKTTGGQLKQSGITFAKLQCLAVTCNSNT